MGNKSIEHLGEWRIFTQSEFNKTLSPLNPVDFKSIGFWPDEESSSNNNQQTDWVYADIKSFKKTLQQLRSHLRDQQFEHGQEGKIARAHLYRPYRLSLEGKLLAIIVLRASEAYNLCEIDIFITTELQGVSFLEVTRAALLFAFSDAAKNAGSMAVQFTKNCASSGVPRPVRLLAKKIGVELAHADQGTLSPQEVREMYLRLCGFSEATQARIRDFANRRFFSIERICYLVTRGLWPVNEASIVLLCAPFPDLILGAGVDVTNRHLSAHSMALASTAVLRGILDRALRYIPPLPNEKKFTEQKRYHLFSSRLDVDQLSVHNGPLPEEIHLSGWAPIGTSTFLFSEGTTLIAFLRSRPKEEIRVFLKHDIEQAKIAGVKSKSTGLRNEKINILLVYASDFLQIPKDDRIEANQFAKQLGVNIIVCPESVADLETEVRRRQRIGRSVRQ